MNRLFPPLILVAAAVAFCPWPTYADDDQSETRENPTVETGNAAALASVNYPKYIKLGANHIQMNGDDWSDLAEVFAAADSCPVNIVHIGDSHLQADMGTAVTRNRLGKEFDHLRGRGLIIPFRLAGTNQPVDYKITSSNNFTQSRLLKLPWPTAMGFTGIAIQPYGRTFNLSVTTEEMFDALTVYYSGDTLEIMSAIEGAEPIPFSAGPVYKGLKISFPYNIRSVDLNLRAPAGTAIHGINASLGETGLAYHVIGNNGAAFSSYTMVGNVANDIAEMFEPDLIIVSLGTNEAFGKISDSEFRRTVDDFVKELKIANPEAKLLLVTPQECHRKTTVRRRRRRKARTSFQVNANVKRMRDIIVAYGRDNSIPVYDWYEVAGGSGSSHKWISDRNINTDHIHLTMSGYRLQGNLFTDALLEQLR